MAAVTDLIPGIQINAPEATSLTIKRLIIEVVRDFCKVTKYWRQDLATVSLAADTATYALTLPADTELVDIKSVSYLNNADLTKKTIHQLRKIDPQYRTTNGTPRHVTRTGVDTIRVYPVPSAAAANVLTPYVALRPTLAATTIDDTIIDDHEETIRHGVLGRLFSLPRKAWTDNALAGFHLAAYENMRDTAAGEADDDRMTGVVRKMKYGGY